MLLTLKDLCALENRLHIQNTEPHEILALKLSFVPNMLAVVPRGRTPDDGIFETFVLFMKRLQRLDSFLDGRRAADVLICDARETGYVRVYGFARIYHRGEPLDQRRVSRIERRCTNLDGFSARLIVFAIQ